LLGLSAPEDGAVFSTGSIAFSESLPYRNFDNNVSKLLANVVKAFSSKDRLSGWPWSAEEKQWR
jgi:N,N-dimethylformamidase